MDGGFFSDVVEPIRFGGLDSTDPLAFKVYDPDRVVLGRRMEDHLRIGVCLWHSFDWPGTDMFGAGTFDRPWTAAGRRSDGGGAPEDGAAFEFIEKLGVRSTASTTVTSRPRARTFAESNANLDEHRRRRARQHSERTGIRLLWGTANLFSHPRYAAGAATNPDPAMFAYAAAQVGRCSR